MELTAQDKALIQEEEANLAHLQAQFTQSHVSDNRQELLGQIFELREDLNCANADDIPQITEQIHRITMLINQQEEAYKGQLDPLNPYFAHMRLEEESGQARDLYIGTAIYRTRDGRVQVIDWKGSPVAQIYFRYEEGDDYEEEIGERLHEGVVLFKRVLKVVGGELVQIHEGERLLYKDRERGWHHLQETHRLLHGGSGTASRPERVVTNELGVGLSGNRSNYKHLPEITSLIDPDQFGLITQPESGVIAIQGSAGSGKTTVALHRVAWLHHQDPQRFTPENMMVMVFNKALANYISKVLPSLGVPGVTIDFYESWATGIRHKLFGARLPREYSEETPISVIRLKKHPALMERIDAHLEKLDQEITGELKGMDKNHAIHWKGLMKLPLIERLFTLHSWMEGKGQIGGKAYDLGGELKARMQGRIAKFLDPTSHARQVVLDVWDEFFSDFQGLQSYFAGLEEDAIPQGQLAEAINWIRDQYLLRHNHWAKEKDTGEESTPYVLDYEDDPILLYFFQKLAGEIRIGGKRLRYAHLLVDEAQDLSPLEMRVLFHFAQDPLSVTFAGDVNQQMIQYNGFKGWRQLFDYLGLEGQEVSNLKVSYRSTYQIMDFAVRVLGEEGQKKEVITTRHGPEVQVFDFAHQGELAQFLATSLKNLTFKEPNASVALITINPQEARKVYEMLEPMEIAYLRLIEDQEFSFTPGIDITDIHQVKGLEFDYVILLDVDTVNYPNNSYHRFLLHVGATRAAHQLWILNRRLGSELLPGDLYHA